MQDALRSQQELESIDISYKTQHEHVLSLARAVRSTLQAEKKVAALHVREAQVFLQVAHDIAEAVDRRLKLAELQLGDVLEAEYQGPTELLSISKWSLQYEKDDDDLNLYPDPDLDLGEIHTSQYLPHYSPSSTHLSVLDSDPGGIDTNLDNNERNGIDDTHADDGGAHSDNTGANGINTDFDDTNANDLDTDLNDANARDVITNLDNTGINTDFDDANANANDVGTNLADSIDTGFDDTNANSIDTNPDKADIGLDDGVSSIQTWYDAPSENSNVGAVWHIEPWRQPRKLIPDTAA